MSKFGTMVMGPAGAGKVRDHPAPRLTVQLHANCMSTAATRWAHNAKHALW